MTMLDAMETANLDVTKDAVDMTGGETNSGALEATEIPIVGMPVYFTEGELLPWKGRWFRIHLVGVGEQKHIELEMLKPTSNSMKRSIREARWLEQHPRSDKARAQREALFARLEFLQQVVPLAVA
jgi:hypothetical protein